MPDLDIQHIIWDWNGTLVDDVQASVNAINRMLISRELAPTTMERYRETFGFPVMNYYRTTGFHLEHEDWDALSREYHAFFLAESSIRIRPSAADVLTACRGAVLSQGVLSAAKQEILEWMMAPSGLARFFNHVTGSDNLHGSSKAACGRDLLQQLALPARHVLFVGDTLHDHEVADQMGCRCLLVCGGHQSRQRLAQSGCPVLDDLADVPLWLARENRTC